MMPSNMPYLKKCQIMPKKIVCKYGSTITHCICCGTARAVIRKFKMNTCRRCLREVYTKFGLVRY